MRFRKYPDLVILFLVGFVAIGYIYLSQARQYRIDTVVTPKNMSNFDKEFNKSIQLAKLFSESVINSYFDFLHAEVNAIFLDSFALTTEGNLSVNLLLSTEDDEAFIHLSSGLKNELHVKVTRLPTQVALFSQLDDPGKEHPEGSSLNRILEGYSNLPYAIGTLDDEDSSVIYLSDVTVRSWSPILFYLIPRSIAVLKDFTSKLRVSDSTEFIRKFGDIAFLCGEEGYGWALKKCREIGEELANLQIQALFMSSPLFRKALAHDTLSTIARMIKEKASRSVEDLSFDYPIWEIQMDMQELKELAQYYGVGDTLYTRELLLYESKRTRNGTLLWYYGGYVQFTVQWLLLNFALLVCLYLIRHFGSRIRSIYWNRVQYLFGSTLIIAPNGWAFLAMPDGMNFYYWLLPGFLFIACLLQLSDISSGRTS